MECYQKGISYESDPTAHQCELKFKLTEKPAIPKILFESCFYENHMLAAGCVPLVDPRLWRCGVHYVGKWMVGAGDILVVLELFVQSLILSD